MNKEEVIKTLKEVEKVLETLLSKIRLEEKTKVYQEVSDVNEVNKALKNLHIVMESYNLSASGIVCPTCHGTGRVNR